MKIAIIGAGISGLAAGNELIKAGHEVVVFEKSRGYGGRLATRYAGKDNQAKLDHGVTYFQAKDPDFLELVNKYSEKGILTTWDGKFANRDSKGNIKSKEADTPYYYAPGGMNEFCKQFGRMLDVRMEEKVSGLTHIGENRTKKRSWMLNFPTALTEGADAVIITAPARQAYALINTTVDEIETLKLIREIDEVEYESQFSLMAGYLADTEMPEWNALECDDEIIQWVSNEYTKRKEDSNKALVVQTTSEFAKQHANEDREKVQEIILDRLAQILDGWAALPEWKSLHYWKYSRAINPLPHDFMEIKGKETPLALIGAYMNGNTVESAYLSGVRLGQKWAKQFSS